MAISEIGQDNLLVIISLWIRRLIIDSRENSCQLTGSLLPYIHTVRQSETDSDRRRQTETETVTETETETETETATDRQTD